MSICYDIDMKKTRTTVHLEEKDKEAIAAIREHYGLSSNDDAIRLALREWHRHITRRAANPTPAPEKERRLPPHE
jgi:Arc/MetJ-type ribon-helix-helix transcriptional regulator